jgi:hypothetical protein
MEPLTARHDAIDRYESPVRHWRVSQLRRFGISGPLAGIYADRIEWHQIARLVRRGCPLGSPCASSCDDSMDLAR